MEIVGFVVSPQHRYDGRPSDGAKPPTTDETPDRIALQAHRGIVDDRYFGTKHAYAAVTLISADHVQDALAGIGIAGADAAQTRRNIIVRGIDVESLVDTIFTLDSGDGPIRFRSLTPANPCAWMDEAFGEGARDALRGHAGIRAEPLDHGALSVGPVTFAQIGTIDAEEHKRLRRSVDA